MSCQYQVGMLVLRPCGAPAGGSCSFCGSQVCAMHTLAGPGGPACPHCAASHQDYQASDDTRMAQAREEYYRPYGGAANYGDDEYFTSDEGAALAAGSMYLPPVVKKKKYDPKDS